MDNLPQGCPEVKTETTSVVYIHPFTYNRNSHFSPTIPMFSFSKSKSYSHKIQNLMLTSLSLNYVSSNPLLMHLEFTPYVKKL